jgi:ketosteroid isomerase-like protein
MSAEDNVDELIKQFALAQGELLKGNSEPAKEMCSHRQDVTLANPLGPVVHGWEQVAAATDQAASQFRDGEYVSVEDISKCVTPELAYIVRIERVTAKVGGQQAVSPVTLRVTMIMRPEDGVWKIVHRHADPITTARPAESLM